MMLQIVVFGVSIAVLAAIPTIWFLWDVWRTYGHTLEDLKDECPDAHDMMGDMLADGGHDPEMHNRHMAKVNYRDSYGVDLIGCPSCCGSGQCQACDGTGKL